MSNEGANVGRAPASNSRGDARPTHGSSESRNAMGPLVYANLIHDSSLYNRGSAIAVDEQSY